MANFELFQFADISNYFRTFAGYHNQSCMIYVLVKAIVVTSVFDQIKKHKYKRKRVRSFSRIEWKKQIQIQNESMTLSSSVRGFS